MSEHHMDDITGFMLLPREAWETALMKLERLTRIEAARGLANEVNDALTLHAPYSWLQVDRTVAPTDGHRGEG